MQAGRTSKAELVDNWCWAFASDEDRRYHDTEWGVPVHDDTRMFEHLSLECLQCGLSWNTILLKRPVFRACFAGFDIDAVAAMGEDDVERILATPGMLRSRAKVRAIIGNARATQRVRDEFGGSFAAYFWSWTDGATILYEGHDEGGIPARNGLSARIAADLKRRGLLLRGPRERLRAPAGMRAGLRPQRPLPAPCGHRGGPSHGRPTARRRGVGTHVRSTSPASALTAQKTCTNRQKQLEMPPD